MITWNELTHQQQQDLLEWYNVREEDIDDADRRRLSELIDKGQFQAWNCPECEERCYLGTPDDWDDFQGVSQVDYVSYPGDAEKYRPEYILQMCDHCRRRC